MLLLLETYIFDGQGIGWMTASHELQFTAQCPSGNQQQAVSLKGLYWDQYCSVFSSTTQIKIKQTLSKPPGNTKLSCATGNPEGIVCHPEGPWRPGGVSPWETQSSTRPSTRSTRAILTINTNWGLKGLRAALWRRSRGTGRWKIGHEPATCAYSPKSQSYSGM